MVHAMSGAEALSKRREVPSPGTGIPHWGTEFFGPRYPSALDTGPQSLMTELSANEVVLPHYHGLTQYQVFGAGSGKMGRNDILPLTVQFKDPYTAYGPVTAGPQGLSFFAMRIKTALAGPVYLNQPGAREKMKPSKRRNLISQQIILSTEPVLQNRKEASWEPILPYEQYDDGFAAQVLRLGAGMSAMGPDPKRSDGYYLFVGNGSLVHQGRNFPLWSMVVVQSDEDAFEIRAGDKGLEVLVLEFPKNNDDLTQ